MRTCYVLPNKIGLLYKGVGIFRNISIEVNRLSTVTRFGTVISRSYHLRINNKQNTSNPANKSKKRMAEFSLVEKYKDEWMKDEIVAELDLSNQVSTESLLTKVKELVKQQPSLLKRKFINVNGKRSDQEYQKDGSSVRIMQWNILADALSTGKDNFINCPPQALEWKLRRLRILEEILKVSPDVLCLQEVDHYGFFAPTLKAVGYEGVFFPKPDSPALYVDKTNGPDGCAIFYKTGTLELVKKECIVLKTMSKFETNQVSVIHTLKSKSSGKEFSVATTHLKAKVGWEKLRHEQGQYLLCYLKDNYKNHPIILSGDFNGDPKEPIYDAVNTCDLNLNSAYKLLAGQNQEPEYTTWKIRGTANSKSETCKTIDYIWYTMEELQVAGLLTFPTGEEIGPDRLPSYTYPSDHFSLAADFIV